MIVRLQGDIGRVRRERGVGDAAGPAGAAAVLPARVQLGRARGPAAAALHHEAAQRLPAQLHPLAGLVAHGAHGAALRRRRPRLRLRARLLLDAPRLGRRHEPGTWDFSYSLFV